MRLVLAALILLAAPASAQFIFVEIPTIPGESTDPEHVDWIEAFALAHDQSIDCSGGGGGGGCTAASFTDISFLKSTDLATPLLADANARGLVLGPVKIDVCRLDGGNPLFCYYKLELENVNITSLSLSSSACIDPGTCGGNQTESVTLNYTRIRWIYTVDDGGKGQMVERCWDIAKNAPC